MGFSVHTCKKNQVSSSQIFACSASLRPAGEYLAGAHQMYIERSIIYQAYFAFAHDCGWLPGAMTVIIVLVDSETAWYQKVKNAVQKITAAQTSTPAW